MKLYNVQVTREDRAEDIPRMEFALWPNAQKWIDQNSFTDEGVLAVSFFELGGFETYILPADRIIQLSTYEDGVQQLLEFDTLEESDTYIADTLHYSDGYKRRALEQPVGSDSSDDLDQRPPLWIEYYVVGNRVGFPIMLNEVNGLGRTDADRN